MAWSTEAEISKTARHPRLPLTELVWRAVKHYDDVSLEAWVTKRSCYRISFSIYPALQDEWFCGFYKRATKGRERWEHIFWCERAWMNKYGNFQTREEALEEALEICTRHALSHGLLANCS
jgi:hypothetical protein